MSKIRSAQAQRSKFVSASARLRVLIGDRKPYVWARQLNSTNRRHAQAVIEALAVQTKS